MTNRRDFLKVSSVLLGGAGLVRPEKGVIVPTCIVYTV